VSEQAWVSSFSEWRISWKAVLSSAGDNFGMGILQIYVFNESGGMVTLAANTMNGGQDISYIHEGQGKFYLTISSAMVEWEISVEEKR